MNYTMNIQSFILLSVVILVAAFVLYRYLRRGGKCSCCDCCGKGSCSAHILLLLLLPTGALSAFAQDVDATTGASEFQPIPRSEKQILAYSNDSTRDVYRIPAIAKNNKGELIAIYDYRVCGTDIGFGEVDQVMRISKNNGRKWSEETKIADGIEDSRRHRRQRERLRRRLRRPGALSGPRKRARRAHHRQRKVHLRLCQS